MTTDRAARALACLGFFVTGCSVALDFGPGVLLPALDAPAADAPAADAPAADAPVSDAPAADCATPGCRACRASEVICGVQCVDLASDERHCGACGRGCAMGSQRCCNGACVARCE